MSYQREITASNVRRSLSLPHKNLYFTGCSQDLIDRAGLKDCCSTVYNMLDFADYTLNPAVAPDAPFMFLGRIERVKGLHTAIKAVLAAGRKLWIGGNISGLAEERLYYDQEIQPLIDGERIVYLGTLNDQQKDYYLQRARALLFAIEWNEPFGIVMIESMACGTPVIGFRKGSVTEVIDPGKTGLIVDSLDEMVAAIGAIDGIDRTGCRKQAEARYDTRVVAKQYLELIRE